MRRALLLLIVAVGWGAALAHPGYHHDVARLTHAIAERPFDAKLYLQRAHH